MKFKFAFEVHSDIFATGTRYVCRMPGLVHVKADQGTLGFLFEYEQEPVWKYLDTSVLQLGWNTISLDGNGNEIVLTANNTQYTVLPVNNDIISFTGGKGKYVTLAQTTPITNANSWSVAMRYRIRPYINSGHCAYLSMSGDTDCQTPSLLNLDLSSKLRALVSSNGTSWNITTSSFDCYPQSNSLVDFIYGYTGTAYFLDYKLAQDAAYSRVWTYTYSTKAKSYVPFQFLNAMDGKENYTLNNHYNDGTLYIKHVKINVNDNLVFDGNTAVLGVDYYNHNCVVNIAERYPIIKTGALQTYQSWLYLKNIQALKLED